MDPVCHTLVGASLGCTGLETRTRYGRACLIIGANLPDIDVVAHLMGGSASYAFRRGITHGIPALLVLPVLLTLALLAWHRLRGDDDEAGSVSAGWLLALGLIAVWTHPLLDWMNTYGMRWLMPVADIWYYGDTLFIIDWIVWVVLAGGLLATRYAGDRSDGPWPFRPAVLALGIVVAYTAFNYGITQTAERRALVALREDPPIRLLVSPVPLTPLRRTLVLEYPAEYRFGEFQLVGRTGFRLTGHKVDRGNPEDLALARETRDGRWFLHWARYPYSVSRREAGGRRITIADARYVPDLAEPRLRGFAVFEFRVPADSDATGPTN